MVSSSPLSRRHNPARSGAAVGVDEDGPHHERRGCDPDIESEAVNARLMPPAV